jgi:tRNA (Thr-GGU) A37 N-methylase
MFTPQAIGFVDSPYTETAAIPKGLGAKHDAEGALRILPEFELGLTDIEGFSHLMVIWVFDRSHRAVQTRSALPSSSYFAVRTDS